MKIIPTVSFGNTSTQVSRVGLGGEGILRTYGQTAPAQNLINAALDEGVTYFDSARVYSDSELYYGSVWSKAPEKRTAIFQTSKSAQRDKDGALADLESTLKRLQTDYLDLWQIHDLRTEDDIRAIERPGGALEAFLWAKKHGKVRFIGVTGHHDPYILARAVAQWPVDSVLMPVNPVEANLGGFLTDTLIAAQKKGIAVIGMKLLGASHYILPKFNITADMLIRFALSYPITLAIVGCSTPAEVSALAQAGRNTTVMPDNEKERIISTFKPYASRMGFYRGVK